MKTEELLNRTNAVLGNINRLKTGVEVCNDAIEKLGGRPEIIIRGDYSDISLDDGDMGLNRKTQASVAEYIMTKIAERRNVMADKLEGVLDAINEAPTDEPEKYPYPMKPKAFGAVSPDNDELW